MKIFITGLPRVGKTTLVLKVAEELKSHNLRIGGFITQEVREKGRRVGFKIKALDTGEEGILAWVGSGYPRV
ncbi:MAG: NTPase, partial [Thermococcus sp.]|nr:NTPase [Thermococcus sp.]